MAKITFQGPTAKIMPAEIGGTPHPVLRPWFDFAKGHGTVAVSTNTAVGQTTFTIDSVHVPSDVLNLALSEGFEAEGAPVFIKMSPATYATDVPVGIRNRSYEDESEQEIVRKWLEWFSENHNHMDAADGDKIVPGNSWGSELSSDELLILLGAGYTLVLGHEVNALLPPPPEEV
jgi:hypothetical protein